MEPRLIAAWPRDSRFARRCFELLSRAYVEARYSAQYEITPEELAWLTARVRSLQEVVKIVCLEHLSDE
ncbi:nucleotidyltransferase protein [Rhizobium grahamii CCGE 502]|uniref:Nucleotidyltransferase protein n=1 Tax=Rhizobium grahamii CCGE 502 TaxID=990285 RepID=S3ID80_9HYPH|nr:nucleotidyltransferase protein [Rhizobium grahamii CCGE 502]